MIEAEQLYEDDGDAYEDVAVDLRGAPAQFLRDINSYRGPLIKREILVAGPGGTGKSRGFMNVLAAVTEAMPGCRGLITRGTRESMSESTLVQFERCWPQGHPILDGPAREGRSVYHHPNGATVAVIGLDKPGKLFSTEFDWIYGEELTGDGTPNSEIPHRTWGLFFRAMRGDRPYNNQHIIVGTCNPSYPDHWVKRKIDLANQHGGTFRERDELGGEYWLSTYGTQLADNPVYHNGLRMPDGRYDPAGWTTAGRAYIAGLKRIPSEHDRRRLLNGEWCFAEGRAFSDFDRDIHVVKGTVDRSGYGHKLILEGWRQPVEIEWYMVSMDFGFRKPGVAQIWAVDGAGRMFRVAEIYAHERQLDWWADKLNILARQYPVTTGVGDSAEPRTIEFLNSRLSWARGRDMGGLIRPADKTRGKVYGFDQIRWGLASTDGGPRMFLLKDAFPFGRDQDLARRGKPTCFEEELDRAIWRRTRSEGDAARNKEDLDPACEDHAIDAAAYAAVYAWGKSLGRTKPVRDRYREGTLGSVLRLNGREIEWPR